MNREIILKKEEHDWFVVKFENRYGYIVGSGYLHDYGSGYRYSDGSVGGYGEGSVRGYGRGSGGRGRGSVLSCRSQ